MVNQFKQKYSLEKRKQESSKIKEKYPDKYPIIVVKEKSSQLPDIDKQKYLAPDHLTIGQFQHLIRKKIDLSETETLFLFINETILPNNSDLICSLYEQHKDEDGFMYVTYCSENVFG
tara:strand:+ start:862 stop:1215 length:354 start_codon:yes stop_codon:yes gene_type:complete